MAKNVNDYVYKKEVICIQKRGNLRLKYEINLSDNLQFVEKIKNMKDKKQTEYSVEAIGR